MVNEIIKLKFKGLQCDNPNCDWKDDSIKFNESIKYLNKPCPMCGSNLLSYESHASTMKLIKYVNWINKWFGWLFPKENSKVQKFTRLYDKNGIPTGKWEKIENDL